MIQKINECLVVALCWLGLAWVAYTVVREVMTVYERWRWPDLFWWLR